MRAPVDAERLRRFMRDLGQQTRGPGRVYLTGGATALLVGWRSSTVDVDIKLAPEPAGVFEAIARLKDELDINVELASPDLFVPVPHDWDARSEWIERHGQVDFLHFDYRAQALAKLARAHERDLNDVTAMVDRGLVTRDEIRDALEEASPHLLRYPGLNAEAFLARAGCFLRAGDDRA